MKFIISLLFLILPILKLQAQTLKESSESEYTRSCNDNEEFKTSSKLKKIENTVYINSKKWSKTLIDTLVEQEDVNMKLYETVGVNEKFCKAIVKEIGLAATKYLLIDLKTKKTDVLNSMPIVSKSLKYIVCISEPESDSYFGLEIFEINKGNLKMVFKENDPKYQYKFRTAKWCGENFLVQRMDNFKKTMSFVRIQFP